MGLFNNELLSKGRNSNNWNIQGFIPWVLPRFQGIWTEGKTHVARTYNTIQYNTIVETDKSLLLFFRVLGVLLHTVNFTTGLSGTLFFFIGPV